MGLWRCASGARLHKSCQLSLSLPGSHLFARVGREAVLNGSIGTVPSTEIKKIKLTALEFKQNILNPPADLTRAVDGASRRARAAMKPEIFATSLRHPREQFDAWRERFSSVFEVTPKDPIGDGFLAETRLWNLGGFAMSRTSAPNDTRSPSSLAVGGSGCRRFEGCLRRCIGDRLLSDTRRRCRRQARDRG